MEMYGHFHVVETFVTDVVFGEGSEHENQYKYTLWLKSTGILH